MTSLDLKEAYFAIPISERFQKYARFQWKRTLYEFVCLCFGLSSTPYYFRKVMKAVFSKEGSTCSFYIDNPFYVHMFFDTETTHTERARELLESMELIVSQGKPVLTPSQEIIHLGFNSKTMTVLLSPEKVQNMRNSCGEVLNLDSNNRTISIRKLHYRYFEMLKINCLKKAKNGYNSTITLLCNARQELKS